MEKPFMLQITVTVCANFDDVTGEARRLERERFVKIHELTPNLILDVPRHVNEEIVIATLAGLARKGWVTEFRSRWVK
jgi:hypothetical protein